MSNIRSGPSKREGALSAVINLPPGTHHLKFIVDAEMRLSDHLPTAVDFTNMLVNYIEVSTDDLPKPPKSQPIEIPAAKGTYPASQDATDTDRSAGAVTARPSATAPTPGMRIADTLTAAARQAEAQFTIPADVRASRRRAASGADQSTLSAAQEGGTGQGSPDYDFQRQDPVAERAELFRLKPEKYHSHIPRFLLHLDAPEESGRFARSIATSTTLPAPPTLPLFLAKSILNMSTPMKDDSSVLMMPNHTVLNHLATSSIRSRVLATSATTRYRRKVIAA